MTSHDVTVAGYLAITAAGFGLEALARRGRLGIPHISTVLSRLMQSRPSRVGIIAGWAWLGLHFFGR